MLPAPVETAAGPGQAVEPKPTGTRPVSGGGTVAPPPDKSAPGRPPTASANLPPVLVKRTPPLPVRLSQLLWALSFAAGTVGIVYFFIIRPEQLPLIADAIRSVNSTREDATYDSAANIVFWSVFVIVISVRATQSTLLVSFMNRKEGIRWWQLATLITQVVLYPVALELAARGEDGVLLRQLLLGQMALVLLALLVSVLPKALAWTAQQQDVRRGTLTSGGMMH